MRKPVDLLNYAELYYARLNDIEISGEIIIRTFRKIDSQFREAAQFVIDALSSV